MTTYPVLALPDFTKPFELQCDTSGEGIGPILMQENHLVAYESRKLIGLEMSYSIYEKEMLAIMRA